MACMHCFINALTCFFETKQPGAPPHSAKQPQSSYPGLVAER